MSRENYCEHISYVQSTKAGEDRIWHVYLLGRYLGDIVRGSASALWRAMPSGRTQLFRDCAQIEEQLARAVWLRIRAAGAAVNRCSS